MYLGVNAYLVDTESGAVEIVGSGQQVEDYLQDLYDERAAEGAITFYAAARIAPKSTA